MTFFSFKGKIFTFCNTVRNFPIQSEESGQLNQIQWKSIEIWTMLVEIRAVNKSYYILLIINYIAITIITITTKHKHWITLSSKTLKCWLTDTANYPITWQKLCVFS